MPTFTLRYRSVPSDAAQRIDAAVRSRGGRLTWQHNAGAFPSYALVENVPPDFPEALLRAENNVAEEPIIALAVSPHDAQALPLLEEALGGRGAPSAIRFLEVIGDAVVVEWSLDRMSEATFLALVDVELARLKTGRRTELLCPLPLEWWTRIAGCGLQAPEIAPGRVLEWLLERQYVVD